MSTLVKVSCHCGRNAFNVAFTTASLPVTHFLCHCDSCRHSAGQLTVGYVRMEGPPLSLDTNEPIDIRDLPKTLTAYRTLPSAIRWFCGTCSAHIFWQAVEPETRWVVAAGALERTDGIIKTAAHIFVGDTLDGGIADHIRVVDGQELPRFAGGPQDGKALLPGWRADEREERKADELPAYCHCGTIRFAITRPSAASSIPSSPFPDLQLPYISTARSEVLNPHDTKWWLCPDGAGNPTRYLAGHCACKTCRLTSGSEIQSWAFIPRANVIFRSDAAAAATGPNGESGVNLQDESQRPKGLERYASSTGRNREFCGTCGATVFWWGSERPDLLDVTVGLLDQHAAGGARAEDWLYWWKDRVSFSEEAVSKDLVNGLERGLRSK